MNVRPAVGWQALVFNGLLCHGIIICSIIILADDTDWKEPFSFVVGADLQIGMIQSYIEKNPEPGWEKEIELGKRAVEKINQMAPKPKFFVMCGDLCDAFPGKK